MGPGGGADVGKRLVQASSHGVAAALHAWCEREKKAGAGGTLASLEHKPRPAASRRPMR